MKSSFLISNPLYNPEKPEFSPQKRGLARAEGATRPRDFGRGSRRYRYPTSCGLPRQPKSLHHQERHSENLGPLVRKRVP